MSQPEMKVSVELSSDRSIKKDSVTTHLEPSAHFREALDDAERLIKYAAEAGIEIDTNIRDGVLAARATLTTGWSEGTAAHLLDSLTKVTATLKPVTAESLKECSRKSQPTVLAYWFVAICLAMLIVPFSVATFVTSAISDAIRKDITAANELAVKLNTQLGPVRNGSGKPANPSTEIPPGLTQVDVVTELQTFASTIRSIDTRSRELNWFIFNKVKDPFYDIRKQPCEFGKPCEIRNALQLRSPLTDFVDAFDKRIQVYQDVRSFGHDIVDDVSVFYGATTTCILPVLYALLGACASLLRSYEQDMRNRTFISSHADFPRFMIAAIAGAVVGLFNNFTLSQGFTISQGASIPPLAIAFLVGYAVDVFFSFLEGLIQAFTKNKSTSNALASEHSRAGIF